MYENEQKPERALLVAVDTGEYDAEVSMAELYELCRSAGAEPCGAMIQKRPARESATCVGSGFLLDISNQCEALGIDLLVFDCELSPTQIRNIEAETDVRTIDRTMLILDIFALRARSREGSLQVELAQLQYLLPRLSGKGTARAKRSSKRTAAIFAEGSIRSRKNSPKLKNTAPCSPNGAKRTA